MMTAELFRQDLINGLANDCLFWSREDLIQYAYDRLYQEYQLLSTPELLEIARTLPQPESYLPSYIRPGREL